MLIANGSRAPRRAAVVAAIMLSVAVTGGAVASAATAADPTITVTPATGLTDGQTVEVAGTGFTPGETVVVGECAVVGDTLACAKGGGIIVSVDAEGGIATPLVVKKSFEAIRHDDTSAGVVDCATVRCGIGAISEDGVLANGQDITFAS